MSKISVQNDETGGFPPKWTKIRKKKNRQIEGKTSKVSRICDFLVNFDWSKFKIRKNSSNWKEIENFSRWKRSEDFAPEKNVKFQLLLSYELISDEFFSNFEHFHEF